MALAISSLALAADSISEELQGSLTDVTVLVDTPAAAQKTSDQSPAKHHLNLFFYRVAPSPVHAAQAPTDPMFLRLFALLTPYPRKTPVQGEEYPALRILGEAIRYFHETPVGPVLHSRPANTGTAYRIQAVLQAPDMEELNHIWTTQGSDIGYQMSAAYEFLLVPVDPLTEATPAGEVRSALYEVRTGAAMDADPMSYDLDFGSVPAATLDGPPQLPRIMAQGAAGPVASRDLSSGDGKVDLVLAGFPGDKAELSVTVRGADGATLRTAKAVAEIKAARFEDPAAAVSVTVDLTGGKSVLAEVRAADAGGQPLVPEALGNTLTLLVDGGA